jgi:thiosulfate dehydrogenase [quinone] large subunit
MKALRALAMPLGVAAAVLLFLLVNPWLVIDGTVRQVVTVAFWVTFVVLLIALFEDRTDPDGAEVEVEGPRFVRFLFNNTRAGLFWLPIRLFVGFSWLEAGWHKFTDPEWTQGGAALRAYWERAASIPEQGRPPITYEWYRDFINMLLAGGNETWFAWVVTFGELAIGVGLILGALTGIGAFFGAFMNMSFLLAGSASTNPVLFALGIGLILAWRVAGYYGLDRYLLPRLGVPWHAKVGAGEAPAMGAPMTS